MVHTLSVAEPRKNRGFFLATVCGNDQRDVFPDRLFRRIAEQPLSSLIPTANNALEILADNGVI
jgi:hypothetical protein